MDRDELAGGTAGDAEQERVSTGSFAGGAAGPERHRPPRVALLLASLAVLAGALLWQHATRGRAPALTQAATASPTPGAAPPAGPSIRIQSRSVTGELTLRLAQRVQTPDGGSALGLIVHVRLASGTETLTPDSFVTAGPDGAPTPAGSVTMLVPGAPLASAEDGFAVTAPATVDVQVILGVPPGDHLVYLVNGETGETLAWFAASG